MITNPARVTARTQLATAEAELADAERALAQLLGSNQHHTTINKTIPAAETRIATARDAVQTAKTERDTHPSKLPANVIDPEAKRARLRTPPPHPADGATPAGLQPRTLTSHPPQHLPARPRRIPRDHPQPAPPPRHHHLHHTGEHRHPGPARYPRLTKALRLLLDEINHTPPRLPDDRRPITYTTK